jgi:excinuclease ABC subunit A
MDRQDILVRGAREHNLRNVDLDLPRNKLIVFSGVSGSGKSSLAFDTLYAEGQRRYVESLSSYARQFMGQMRKPDVDLLAGLSPSISIQQKAAARNPRSTVGTITELHDYLRVLYARVGQGHCTRCDRPITAQSSEQIVQRITALPQGSRLMILAPVIRGQKGEYRDLFADMLRRGHIRARVDGEVVRLTDDLKLDRKVKHDIEIVIDRLRNEPAERARLAEAVEQGLTLGEGSLIVQVEAPAPPGKGRQEGPAPSGANGEEAAGPKAKAEDILFSSRYACTHCNVSYEPPSPQLFSFNSPHGMCPGCDGLGTRYSFDPDLLIPDPSLSLYHGAVPLIGAVKDMGRWRRHIFEGVARALEIDLRAPWASLPEQHRRWLLHGSGDRHITWEWKQRGGSIWKHGGTWGGIIPELLAQHKKASAGPRRMQLDKYMRALRCTDCGGHRLNAQARAVRVAGKSITEACTMPVGQLAQWLASGGPLEQSLSPVEKVIAEEVLKELRGRTRFLLNVGLHYLTLGRAAPSLSGGEAQRIRLAGQIGCGLVGVLYILDEPSIGLHPRDNERLLRSLEDLRDLGNTVLVVEHDEETIRRADHVVDFGPGPGVRGGQVVASGTFADVLRSPDSLTGQYLSGKKTIPIPAARRPPNGKLLRVVEARHNNLRGIDVAFPLGLFVCVTGVSGSGKSSLVNDILREGLRARLGAGPDEEDEDGEGHAVGSHGRIEGVDLIDKVIDIDQSPIGRTPRSNPATYIKVFDQIRSLFASLPESRARGYAPGRFSFNKPGGRCEACEGNGSNRLEMDFLADVWATCPVCEGKRFARETLHARFKGKSIHDVLEMDVQEALAHFENIPKIHAMLRTLHDVGLDYIKLGQPAPTLSGGEAQRVKLARELCRRSTGKTLYILDEPTTGLHFDDIQKLLTVLHGFVDAGNTVVVIEHNLDVLKTADWLIDLGPEGGEEGGQLVAEGPPEAVAACKESHTGQALAGVLRPRKASRAAARAAKAAPRQQPPEAREILIEGACQHNLKSVDARLPRGKMTVFCGPSGSGKSSLALDTIYAEGQRRYIESLSAYARQFLGQLQKPKVGRISGLSPAIAIEQKAATRSPRSTVGTITEVQDYLRVLFARLATPYCPQCRIPVGTQSADEVIARILALPEGAKLYLLAPLERKGQEKYEALYEEARKAGYLRVRVDGTTHDLSAAPEVGTRRKHVIEVVVDRVIVRPGSRGRIAEAVEKGLALGKGVLRVAHVDEAKPEPKWKVEQFSQHYSCEKCGKGLEPLSPHHFSFNSPLGWCPACEGLGVQKGASPALVVRGGHLTVREGAISAWPDLRESPDALRFAEALAAHVGFSLDEPYESLDPAIRRALLHGTGDAWIPLTPSAPGVTPVKFQYKGVFPAIDEAARVSMAFRQRLEGLVTEVPCAACDGSRLKPEPAAARLAIAGASYTMGELCALPIGEALRHFQKMALTAREQEVAGELLREVRSRLGFLDEVGLEYVTLGRPGPTLSGGEAQRIRLASQVGSGLTGVLYVLDEPTIGLHPRDNTRLLGALGRLRDLGNTLILVEHDREVIHAADHLLDFGPGAGVHGGTITARGTPAAVLRSKQSLTGAYLSGRKSIPVPSNRRLPADWSPERGPCLLVRGARQNNLRNVDVAFPLGALVAVTGVSGSGKSSLVNEVLYQTLARKLHRASLPVAAHDEILGIEEVDKVINVDQAPIGSTPSSNPATYTGVFDLIRELFAQLPQARARGYQPKRFSFNKPGGRCEACEGNGQKRIEMHFLPDVWVTCDVCQGKRYNPETLAVRYRERSISDVLDLSVAQALEMFANLPKIRVVLQTLADVGLGYMALGQPAPTLSGGEAQRVKLAAELARPSTGRTVYLLDEPTTGLHFDDISRLLEVLARLADLGNTVIVVEHNLDVIKTADWCIDLGPEAGPGGGTIVVAGPPEALAACAASHTGRALAPVLQAGPVAHRPRFDPLAVAAPREGDLDLEDVGAGQAMPWEADGRRWHTQERLSHGGKPCRWEGAALAWVEGLVQEQGGFAPTNWSQRHVVEVTGPRKSDGWFLHALTGEEWLLRLVFRVGRGAFKSQDLAAVLGIKPLNDSPELGLPVYSPEPRVWVTQHKGPWSSVTVRLHRRSEIDTPAFRDFVRKAAESFHATLGRLQVSPEDLMPWKRSGEKWHLSDKGFPPGRKPRWDLSALPRLLALLREVEPGVEPQWGQRAHFTLRVPGISRAWCFVKTKEPGALIMRFVGKPGQLNLARLEGLAATAELEDRGGTCVMTLSFLHSPTGGTAARLKAVLAEQLKGFREVAGSAPDEEEAL